MITEKKLVIILSLAVFVLSGAFMLFLPRYSTPSSCDTPVGQVAKCTPTDIWSILLFGDSCVLMLLFIALMLPTPQRRVDTNEQKPQA